MTTEKKPVLRHRISDLSRLPGSVHMLAAEGLRNAAGTGSMNGGRHTDLDRTVLLFGPSIL